MTYATEGPSGWGEGHGGRLGLALAASESGCRGPGRRPSPPESAVGASEFLAVARLSATDCVTVGGGRRRLRAQSLAAEVGLSRFSSRGADDSDVTVTRTARPRSPRCPGGRSATVTSDSDGGRRGPVAGRRPPPPARPRQLRVRIRRVRLALRLSRVCRRLAAAAGSCRRGQSP